MTRKIHPRTRVVEQARRDVSVAIDKAVDEHDLTDGEYLQVLARVFGDSLGTFARLMVRDERHGDLDKPGDLE